MTGQPITDRTLPYPWGLCDTCGKAAGLPEAGHPSFYRCPACAARNALMAAAQADLEALASPVLGAWAAQWTAAGLTPAQVEEVTEWASGAWMNHEAADTFRHLHLRRLARAHRAPAFEPAQPDRVAFDVDALPMLTAYRPADPARGMRWPHFTDGEGKAYTLHPGCDVLTLAQPDGDRVLIYTGQGGQTPYRALTSSDVPGFRVPAHLWPQVQAALSGEDRGGPA